MATTQPAGTSPGKHVLIVDDDRAIREMLQVALEVEGYTVWTLDGGRNVVAALLEASGPCVVLLDLMMPGVSGWDVCQAIQQDARLSRHAVAVMTAGMMKGDACPAPARALLAKPFDLDQVYALVEALAASLRPWAAAAVAVA